MIHAEKFVLNISQNYSFAILRPLQEAIRQSNRDVCWFVQGNSVNLKYFKDDEKVLSSVKALISYAPDAVIYPANIAPTCFPGINVAVFHGFDAGKLDKKGNNDHYKIRNCFDLYCTQGPESTAEFQRLAVTHNTFRVIETGWCALDPLFKKPSTTEISKKPTILMCSTFSKKLSCAPHLFNTVKLLSQTGKWRWLIQFHPKMDKNIVEQYKSIQNDDLTFVETDDVIPLLKQADVMVCDTSSVLIMFLLQGKPVVTFNNVSPENYLIDINDPKKLAESIEYALTYPKDIMDNIQKYIQRIHPYADGNSSLRVLEAVDTAIAKKSELRRKPFDLFRQFKMRKELKYWYL